MGTAAKEIVKDVVRDIYSYRYVVLMNAHYMGELSMPEIARICFHVMALDRKAGILRSDRPVPEESKDIKVMESRQIAINKNYEDGFWLEKLDAFFATGDNQMSEKEHDWFDYLRTGAVKGTVAVVYENRAFLPLPLDEYRKISKDE